MSFWGIGDLVVPVETHLQPGPWRRQAVDGGAEPSIFFRLAPQRDLNEFNALFRNCILELGKVSYTFRKAAMMSAVETKEVTMAFSAEHLKDRARGVLAMSLAAYALDIPLSTINAGRRNTDAAFARQVAMYIAHVAFGMSIIRVASAFGRDRSTVAHACHLIEGKRDDRRFDRWLDALERSAASAPAPFIAGGRA
jgi:Bacterial dnaA protein helix-turn-helix